ncbi:MAG: hypothetical protein KF777_05205 [Planctomycetaceae bacterium]|nr:hypothetical protein [Planctomycetaceae bacterium]
MKFRRFNDLGVKAFAEYLEALRADATVAVPTDLLANPRLTEPLSALIEAEPPASFASRMAFAQWLHAAATANGVDIPRNDAGFWAWLSLALFDHVCPADAKGMRKIKEDARYLPMLDLSRRYYRHALVGPFYVYWMYRDSPEQAAAVLCGSLTQLNDEAYRLFVENQLVVMPSAVGVLTKLYYDGTTGRLKPKSKTKKRGSIRRLATFLTRFARTLDLDVIPVERLISILPSEFNRWREPLLFDPVKLEKH